MMVAMEPRYGQSVVKMGIVPDVMSKTKEIVVANEMLTHG